MKLKKRIAELVAAHSGYDGSWKNSVMKGYGKDTSGYYILDSQSYGNKTRNVTVSAFFDVNTLAKRVHTGKLRLTSDSDSSVVESYEITITKD